MKVGLNFLGGGGQETERDAGSWVAWRLRFPPALEEAGPLAFLEALSGLSRPGGLELFTVPHVVFEVSGSSDGIEHHLLVHQRWSSGIRGALRVAAPNIEVDVVTVPHHRVDLATEYRLTSGTAALRRSGEAVAQQFLGALEGLKAGEKVVGQWTLAPASAVPVSTDRDPSGLERDKWKEPVLLAVGRLGAASPLPDRTKQLMARAAMAWAQTKTPGTQLVRRRLPLEVAVRRLERRHVPRVEWPVLVSTSEVLGLLAWPLGTRTVRGAQYVPDRRLAVPADVATEGSVLGDGTGRDGQPRPVALDDQGRGHHVSIIAPTGGGKSTLMHQLALADIASGKGVLFIEPKGPGIRDLLARIPVERHADVVVLNPASKRPVGIHPLRRRGVDPELAVEHLVATLHRIFQTTWGVYSEDLYRLGFRTLICDPDSTVLDIAPLFTDVAFRRRMLELVQDPLLLGQWRAFEALSPGEQGQMAAPLLNKHRQLFGRASLRHIFGQAHPSFDLATVLDAGGIVLVPLNEGLIGADAAFLYATVLMGLVWDVIQGRALRPSVRRRPLRLHLDELGRYEQLPVPIEELLSMARSFDVGITVSLQHLGQVSADLRRTVLANPRSRLAFQTTSDDARVLAREFGGEVTAEDFRRLGPHEALGQLYGAGRTQAPCTFVTRPLPKASGRPSHLEREAAERYGADPAAVDAAIAARHNAPPPPASGSTGRKRRPT